MCITTGILQFSKYILIPLIWWCCLWCWTGNICRSPIAEAVFRKMATDGGIVDQVKSLLTYVFISYYRSAVHIFSVYNSCHLIQLWKWQQKCQPLTLNVLFSVAYLKSPLHITYNTTIWITYQELVSKIFPLALVRKIISSYWLVDNIYF